MFHSPRARGGLELLEQGRIAVVTERFELLVVLDLVGVDVVVHEADDVLEQCLCLARCTRRAWLRFTPGSASVRMTGTAAKCCEPRRSTAAVATPLALSSLRYPGNPRGCSSMVRVPAFQAGYAGSIPVTRSQVRGRCGVATGRA